MNILGLVKRIFILFLKQYIYCITTFFCLFLALELVFNSCFLWEIERRREREREINEEEREGKKEKREKEETGNGKISLKILVFSVTWFDLDPFQGLNDQRYSLERS